MSPVIDIVTDNKGRFVFPKKFKKWCTHQVVIETIENGWRVRRGETAGSPLDERGRMRVPEAVTSTLHLEVKPNELLLTISETKKVKFSDFVAAQGM